MTPERRKLAPLNPAVLLGFFFFAIVAVASLILWDNPGLEIPSPMIVRSTVPSPPQTGGRGGVVPATPSPGASLSFSLSAYGPNLSARVTNWSTGARSYGATVEVTNRSAKTHHFVMVRVEFYNASGQVVGSMMSAGRRDEYIPPGGARRFTVTRTGKLSFATARASVVYSAEFK